MFDAAVHIALAHLAVALIPGHSLALVAGGIAASGVVGGLRVMAGITCAKLIWTAAALGLLPLVLSAGPDLLPLMRIGGGLTLAGIGLHRLFDSVGQYGPKRAVTGTIRGGLAASLASPATSVFFLSAFPAMAAPLPVDRPEATGLLLLVIAVTSIAALLPWFALGLVARRFGPQRLQRASGGLMCLAGGALAASAF